jgi:hypothetical protein
LSSARREDRQDKAEFGPATAPHSDDEENILRKREDEDDEDQSMHWDVFGPVIYNMEFATAIQKKNTSPTYRIWVPSIRENNDALLRELSVYDIEDTILRKCMFFFSCVLNHGSRNTIVYCEDTTQIEKFRDAGHHPQRLWPSYALPSSHAPPVPQTANRIIHEFGSKSQQDQDLCPRCYSLGAHPR